MYIPYIFNRKIIFFLFLLVFYFCTRIVYLESDLPPFYLLNYQPIDELFYSITSFNIFHYGSSTHQVINYIPDDGLPIGLAFQFLTSLNLKIFGNNYYGIRLVPVFSQFLFFILFITICLKSISGNERFYLQKIFLVHAICLLCMIVDFSYLYASRVYEPTVFRVTSLVFVMFYVVLTFSSRFVKCVHLFFIGFFSMFSVLFVYLQDCYIVLASFFFVGFLLKGLEWQRKALLLFSFLIGLLSCVILYAIIVQVAFDMTILDFYEKIAHLRSRTGLKVDSSVNELVVSMLSQASKNISNIFATNFLKYNASTLYLFLLSSPFFFIKVHRDREAIDCFVFFLIIAVFIQSFVFNDYPARKYLILYPIFIFMILRGGIYFFVLDIARNKGGKVLVFIYSWLVFICCLYNIWRTGNVDRFGVNAITDNYFLQLSNITIILMFILSGYIFFFRRIGIGLVLLFVVSSSPSAYLTVKYLYKAPTYQYKSICEDIAKEVGEDIVIGSYSYGFRIYGSFIPVLNPYLYQYRKDSWDQYVKLISRAAKEGDAIYSISNSKSIGFYNDLEFKMIKKYKYNNAVLDEIALYKYIPED